MKKTCANKLNKKSLLSYAGAPGSTHLILNLLCHQMNVVNLKMSQVRIQKINKSCKKILMTTLFMIGKKEVVY